MLRHYNFGSLKGLFAALLVVSAMVMAPIDEAAAACRGEWAEGNTYQAGDVVTYQGSTYTARSTHTAHVGAGWNPVAAPSLWAPGGTCATPTPSPTPTVRPTPTPTTTVRPTPTPTTTVRPTPTPTTTVRPTPTPTTTVRPTPTPTTTVRPTPTPTPTPTATGTPCWTPWVSTTAYTGGAQVSRNNQNYQAAYWTQGNDPTTSSGPAGSGQPWIPMGPCGTNPTPTPTPTTTVRPTPTPTTTVRPTPTPTPTTTVRPTPTPTPTVTPTPTPTGNHEPCRPDGLYKTPGVNVPYCTVYDTAGREKMAVSRRIIGYFPSWRTGKNGQPGYLVKDIPWDKITHINFAFGHIENNRLSVGAQTADNPAIGMEWPGVAGAEMDPSFSFKGHFNLLAKYKKSYPQVKTLISVGGWAETGGYFDASGNRVANGGFYTLTDSQANMNTFADSVVTFLRTYKIDGVDIDYEYATSMKDAGNPLDWSTANARRGVLMQNYVALMRTLRQKLDAAGAADNKHYLLTVAAPSSAYLLRGMDAYQVTEYLDYLNVMSYDLHGAWNEYVGPNAALYDDGRDNELTRWNVYGAYGIGYLNTDWSYHYFRGAMPPGRINIGVPYYTRGHRNVNGGTNGLWGTAAKSSGCAQGLTTCGDGAMGIDNIWHDKENGVEIGAGASPMWHAKNLERGIQPSYGSMFGLTPDSDPEDRITGTYQRFYDATLVAPWLWNATKRVFLSTEDEQSLGVKADYVVSKGIGGIMFWELSGDYNCPASGECFIGNTMTTTLYNKFRAASAYTATRATRAMPTQHLNVTATVGGYPLGDSNFPISPKLTLTNNSTTTIPGGAVFEFDYSTSNNPATLSDQSGFGTSTFFTGHTGNNTGAPGLRGDYHRARFTMPSWQSLAPGASVTVTLSHQLPTSMFSNWIVTFGGQSYGLTTDWSRGMPVQ